MDGGSEGEAGPRRGGGRWGGHARGQCGRGRPGKAPQRSVSASAHDLAQAEVLWFEDLLALNSTVVLRIGGAEVVVLHVLPGFQQVASG